MQHDTPKHTRKYVIKLFSEIMIKGSKAKRQMIDTLRANLLTLLRPIDKEAQVIRYNDKLEVLSDGDRSKILSLLTKTPGIERVDEAIYFSQVTDIETIKIKTLEVMGDALRQKRFVVRAKRSGKHPFTSSDIERQVGGYLLAKSEALGVDLHRPDIVVKIELIDTHLFIVTQSHKALGGFPLGTQGEAISLISGGFDSSVATYLTIKRGIITHFLFFNLGGDAHEAGVKQIAFYLWSTYGASSDARFITIPFEGIIEEMFRSVPPSYLGVMLKRLMLQSAQAVADAMHIDALVTGESVAQVSSQTLRNLSLIDQATSKLVLRPLAMMDKQEIIALAETIGVRAFAEQIPEYCGVISKNPVTHGSFKRLSEIAKKFDMSKLQEAIRNAADVPMKEIIDTIPKNDIQIVHHCDPKHDIIIDIRQTDQPLKCDGCEVRLIPFYKLKEAFQQLPEGKNYLLYCDKGVLSSVHAHYLKDRFGNTRNIKVYRPLRQ